VFAGPWIKAIEKCVYKLKWFVKHTPVPDRPALVEQLKKAGARYFGSDFKAYESHFIKPLMNSCECVLFKYMLQSFPEIARVLCDIDTGKNIGRTRAGVQFIVQARRMSGDMWTSLANGFSNLMLWSYLCEMKGTIWDGLVEGDDGLFAVYAGEPPTVQDYADCGMTIDINEFRDPGHASFCGIVSADGCNMRDPYEFLQKFGWTSSCLHAGDRIMHELLLAKALSAIYEMPQCPVVSPIARRALQIAEDWLRDHKFVRTPRFEVDGYHKAPPSAFQVPEYAPSTTLREGFHQLYGISIAAQLELESKIIAKADLGFISNYIYWIDSENRRRIGVAPDDVHFSSRFVVHV